MTDLLLKDPTPGSEADDPEAWAICCSGGGIRSASYCLGALQWLERAGVMKKAKLIVGVSGGGYIASSRALVAHGLEKDGVAGADPPYAPGTAEEEHLRDNTKYLVPDAKTLLAGVLSLLFGVAATLVLVLTPLFAVAHVWGWVLRSRGVLTVAVAPGTHTQQWSASLTAASWWIYPAVAAGLTVLVFLWWWVTLAPGSDGRDRHSQLAVKVLGWAAFVTLVLAAAMLAVPAVLAWLSGSHAGDLKTVLDDLGFGAGVKWTPAAVAGFVTAIVAVSQSARKVLGKYNLLQGTAAAGTKGPATPSGFAATVTGYLRGLILPWLASALVLLVFALAGLRWVKDGAAAGFTHGQLWLVIGALGVMLVMRNLADLNRISLHDFYRWRLATAYAVTRDTSRLNNQRAPLRTTARPDVRLSELGKQQPELVLCATANINAQREVPPGRGGLSFTFDPVVATLRGPVPGESVEAPTAAYEDLVGRNRFTLFDVSAISGAAFSPLMGSATQRALRILFTATDLRLGVWLPHPKVVAAAAEQGDVTIGWWRAAGLMLWYVLPHPRWRRQKDKLEEREARLWAYVLTLRKEESRFRQWLGGVFYHALQPTLGMLYAEAVGHTSYRGTWMCVTDGGHYDNLGLVEALHRADALKVKHVLVLDASGDKADTWFTLGGSIALARSDAGVDVALNPTKMITAPRSKALQLAPGQVVCPWVDGTLTPQGTSDAEGQRDLMVCKLGWWTGAPWDVRAYAAGHPAYPTDSTLEQLYDSAEFDAYRELGACSVQFALEESKVTI